MTNVEYILKRYIHLIPPIILIGNLLSVFFYSNDVVYRTLASSIGTSFLMLLFPIYLFFYTKNYCWFTKLSVWGLVLITLFDLLNTWFISDNYYYLYQYWYTIIIFSIVLSLSIYYTIMNK